ncbi:hypothetical protein EVAR_18431_1 [Eumeta japonica]|uniref:Uncharacterized protein n=1 Tax=Eumeta variegata TaxID=151549 RepID=A0A4C1UU06_EUMVA|nr:hypothetical protein EVAR_18431_1 [Eumeta japonica]
MLRYLWVITAVVCLRHPPDRRGGLKVPRSRTKRLWKATPKEFLVHCWSFSKEWMSDGRRSGPPELSLTA